MLQLPKESILEFQKIFEKERGKKISFTEATEAANNLIGFFDLLLKIDMRNKKNVKKEK